MKKICFFVTFMVITGFLNMMSGIMVHFLYEPNVKELWEEAAHLSNTVVLKATSPFLFIGCAMLGAILANLLTIRICKRQPVK